MVLLQNSKCIRHAIANAQGRYENQGERTLRLASERVMEGFSYGVAQLHGRGHVTYCCVNEKDSAPVVVGYYSLAAGTLQQVGARHGLS